jgi:nucleoside-diphosphate-sugar epimerase
MTEQVLVTGGTGFIASWTIVELLRRGYSVRTTLRDLAKADQVRAGIESQVPAGDHLTFVAADLTKDAGWDDAVRGYDYVLHIASPISRQPKTDEELNEAARGGALRVLKAATDAGVKRVVMTSAAATARVRGSNAISNETIWADPNDPLLDRYRRSKILSERAAWEFNEKSGGKTTLTTILPGAVFGPLLPGGEVGSVWIVKNLLEGKPPRLLNLGLSVVDVRDLAAAHVEALTAPEAPGQRFLCTGHFLWMPQIAKILREGLGPEGEKVPSKVLPAWLVGPLSLFVPQLRAFRHDIGQKRDADNSKAQKKLKFNSRPAKDTLIDCARSLPKPPRP